MYGLSDVSDIRVHGGAKALDTPLRKRCQVTCV